MTPAATEEILTELRGVVEALNSAVARCARIIVLVAKARGTEPRIEVPEKGERRG